MTKEEQKLPLEGIVVLDLARRYPGAYTAMFLGDFGADVIKIDPPGAVFPQSGQDTESERFAAFYAFDRNKRSLILNLKCKEGQDVFVELVRKADVLIEGFRPGVMSGLGVGFDRLQQVNPRLVYCSLTGYGQDGPYADLPGHDMNFCAIAGALSLIGPKDGPPYFASNFLADLAGAGLHAVIGILMALNAREKTGKGQFVDVSYLDTVISLEAMTASSYFATGKVPRRGETVATGSAPYAQALECKDGEYIVIGCVEPQFWKNLCHAVGREDLVPLQNPTSDKEDWVFSQLREVFRTRTRDEWWEHLKDKDTCVGPVYYFNEAFEDPQVRHRKMVLDFDHPTVGKVRQTGIPIKLSDTPGKIRSLGTRVGKHTDEILSQLGFEKNEIEKLRSGNVVK